MKGNVFVTCPRGLEEVTAQEVKLLLSKDSKIDSGGIHLDASINEIYNLNRP